MQAQSCRPSIGRLFQAKASVGRSAPSLLASFAVTPLAPVTFTLSLL